MDPGVDHCMNEDTTVGWQHWVVLTFPFPCRSVTNHRVEPPSRTIAVRGMQPETEFGKKRLKGCFVLNWQGWGCFSCHNDDNNMIPQAASRDLKIQLDAKRVSHLPLCWTSIEKILIQVYTNMFQHLWGIIMNYLSMVSFEISVPRGGGSQPSFCAAQVCNTDRIITWVSFQMDTDWNQTSSKWIEWTSNRRCKIKTIPWVNTSYYRPIMQNKRFCNLMKKPINFKLMHQNVCYLSL